MQSRAEEWIDRIANELSRLGTRAEPHQLADFGFEMWRTSGNKVPEQVARGPSSKLPPYGD